MSRPLERVLLVGGPFDGTWHEVLQGSTIFERNYSPPQHSAEIPVEEIPAMTTLTRFQYVRQGWTVASEPGKPHEFRYVFVHGHTPAQLFDRLLEKYAPSADERIKQLEASLQFANESLRIANEMIVAHHKTRLGIP